MMQGRPCLKSLTTGRFRWRTDAWALKGEALVLAHERAWLKEHGRADLADSVRHVAAEVGDGLGYDISSFHLDGRSKYVEVKTTAGGIQTPFYLSSAEIEFASQHEDEDGYVIYRVYECGPEPKFFVIHAPLSKWRLRRRGGTRGGARSLSTDHSMRIRSAGCQRGRPTCRSRTRSWCRRARTSASSLALGRPRTIRISSKRWTTA